MIPNKSNRRRERWELSCHVLTLDVWREIFLHFFVTLDFTISDIFNESVHNLNGSKKEKNPALAGSGNSTGNWAIVAFYSAATCFSPRDQKNSECWVEFSRKEAIFPTCKSICSCSVSLLIKMQKRRLNFINFRHVKPGEQETFHLKKKMNEVIQGRSKFTRW